MRAGRILNLAVVLLWCLASVAQTSAHPNFTGVWKLDPRRSNLPAQSPGSIVLYIHQNDPDFHLRRTEIQHGKSVAWSVHGRTDGSTLQLKSRAGMKRTHMYWQGSELVLEVRNEDRRGHSQLVMRYSLSDGGRTLIAREANTNQEWIFTKSG